MAALPEIASKAWDSHKGPMILSTVDTKGMPNSIYVGCVHKYSEEKLVIADNFFHKTRANINAGSPGVLLYITEEGKAFQIKGSLEYHTSGKIYEEMKNGWLDEKFPGVAATVLNVEEVYIGADKLL